jgi:hypothetical protein
MEKNSLNRKRIDVALKFSRKFIIFFLFLLVDVDDRMEMNWRRFFNDLTHKSMKFRAIIVMEGKLLTFFPPA